MRTVSPGDSISDNSKKPLQRGRGGGQYICDFGEGSTCNQAYIYDKYHTLYISYHIDMIFAKITYILTFPSASLERFLRVI